MKIEWSEVAVEDLNQEYFNFYPLEREGLLPLVLGLELDKVEQFLLLF